MDGEAYERALQRMGHSVQQAARTMYGQGPEDVLAGRAASDFRDGPPYLNRSRKLHAVGHTSSGMGVGALCPNSLWIVVEHFDGLEWVDRGDERLCRSCSRGDLKRSVGMLQLIQYAGVLNAVGWDRSQAAILRPWLCERGRHEESKCLCQRKRTPHPPPVPPW